MSDFNPSVSTPVSPFGSGQSPELVVDAVNGPYFTIQAAVNNARQGDTIRVQPGTYNGNIVVTTDYLTIIGAQTARYGWPDITSTSGVTLTVTAQGFTAKRCRFVASTSDAVRQEGNGFLYDECVFDGDAGQAATDALLNLKGNDDDDSFTASEGKVSNCVFRGSDGFGIAFTGGETPGNGVGSTHCQIGPGNTFIDNVAADMVTRDNSSTDATYSVQDVLIVENYFMEPKNKATWIDFTTSNGGAASDQTGAIVNCFFNDDTIDTTAIAIVGTGFGVVGCHSMDGEFDGSGLD